MIEGQLFDALNHNAQIEVCFIHSHSAWTYVPYSVTAKVSTLSLDRVIRSAYRSSEPSSASMNSDDEESVPASEAFPDLKDPAKRVGIIFRGIRSKNNLTQAEVAERLGIDQSDVSKIEKGKRSIGKALAKKIEKEFGIDYRRLL